MSEDWEQWINSERCIPILDKCAEDLYHDEKDLLENILGFGGELALEQKEDELNVIRDELWAFLKAGIKDDPKKLELIQSIRRGDISAFKNRISYWFINQCKEKRRHIDPLNFHFYYSKVRKDLHAASKKDKSLQYKGGTKATYYAFSDKPDLEKTPEGLWIKHFNTHFEEWGMPEGDYNVEETKKKKNIIMLARFFWDESVKIFKREYLIPARELALYISSKYNLVGGFTRKPYKEFLIRDDFSKKNETSNLKAAPSVATEDEGDNRKISEPELKLLEKEIETSAENLVKTWDKDLKEIFVAKFDERKTISDLHESGFKSIYYKIEKVLVSIRERWMLIYPADLIEDSEITDKLSQFFYDKILFFAKK